MSIIEFIKKNLRLFIFFGGVLGLTIYLLGTTRMEAQQESTAQPTESQTVTSTEATSEEETVDSAIEMNTGDEVKELKVEARLSTITEDVKVIDGHQFLTDNQNYQLFYNPETLSIVVRNKQNGAVMYSTVDQPQGGNESWMNFAKSPIVVNYITEANTGFNQLDVFSSKPEMAVSKTPDGFSAKVQFPEQGFSFEIQVVLTEEGVTVSIPDDSIEEKSDKFRIGEIYLYPFMGYSMMAEEAGYMFLPDGSGSLIDLKDNEKKFSQPFSQPIYGEDQGVELPKVQTTLQDTLMSNDANTITAPIYGMVHTDKKLGFLAIIEQGAANGTLEAYPNGAILPYNWVTAKFTYRSVYPQATSRQSGTVMILQKQRNTVNAKVCYRFISDKQADYLGLAESYREYLISHQLIQPKQTTNFMRVDFFGADNENGLISKNQVKMTTYEQMEKIMKDIQEAKMNHVTVGLKGWQEGGPYGDGGDGRFQAEAGLGGSSQLNHLFEQFGDVFDIRLYSNLLEFYPESENSQFDLFTRLNKKQFEAATFEPVYKKLNYFTPDQSKKLLAQMHQSDVIDEQTSLSVAGISNQLFSYYREGKDYDRNHALTVYKDLLKELKDKQTVELENPFQDYWQYTDAMTEMPLSSSNYVFESQEIPFFGLALRGLMPMYAPYYNFEANREEYLLKVLESGIQPAVLITEEDSRNLRNTNSSDIYTSQYANFKDDIATIYQQVVAVNNSLGDATIISHECKGNQVVVSYDNGMKLLLNYSDKAAVVEGQNLSAYGYKVVS